VGKQGAVVEGWLRRFLITAIFSNDFSPQAAQRVDPVLQLGLLGEIVPQQVMKLRVGKWITCPQLDYVMRNAFGYGLVESKGAQNGAPC